ncbi:MAG: hypothetical protein WDO69_05020 [Pseudomonadota bacterium]
MNANNTAALSELSELANQVTPECITPCLPCTAPGVATCTPAGSCESGPPSDRGISCKVGGVVYPSGATGIPDPISCNKCSCDNGQLGCTDAACPLECPAGTKYGTQCVQCGPTDACLVIEHACLPMCSDTCGSCQDGICRQFCG